jgi:quercetin dioxygenase-like cupin family protein
MSKYHSLRVFLIGFALIVPALLLQAQEKAAEMAGEHQADHIMLVPTDLTWTNGPASLPKGTKSAAVEGDPTKAGAFTMRLKLPANYKVPPHWHPGVEHVTVLSGSFYMGLGEVFDESKARKLPVGGFALMAIGTRHFAFTKEEATIQLHGIGPWGITYVNSADDPRK